MNLGVVVVLNKGFIFRNCLLILSDDLKLYEALHRIITQHVRGSRAREAPKKVATLENIINKLNCKNFGQCYGIVPESFAYVVLPLKNVYFPNQLLNCILR